MEKHRGRPLTRDDLKKLERLNRLLVQDDSFSQIATATNRQRQAFRIARDA
jgi:hypothetical protein